MNYSLAPSFECPFGWPKQPHYPIDLAPTQDCHHETPTPSLSPPQSSPDPHHISSLYLEALYAPDPLEQASLVQAFASTLRSYPYHAEHDHQLEELIDIYESFLIPEHLLVKKWSEEINKLLLQQHHSYSLDWDLIQVDQQENLFHPNELNHLRASLLQLHTTHSLLQPHSSSNSKNSFIKPDSLSKQLEIWSIRETQLQIITLLELIILTNLTLESGTQLLFHHKQLTSSPSKTSRKDKRKGRKEEDTRQEQVFSDLESALEGLIDRLAMWQIIGGLENQLSKTTHDSANTTASVSHLVDPVILHLDDVQWFWSHVIEENYAEHLPLLSRSFRPKLFPTSIYDASTSSSIIPTKFEATSNSNRRGNGGGDKKKESSILSSVTRTPNLKRLEKKANRTRGNLKDTSNHLLLSPTMMELNGLQKPKKYISTSHLTTNLISSSTTTNTNTNTNNNNNSNQTNISSRSLFNRRQVKMSKVPSKSKLSIHQQQQQQQRGSNQSSVCFKKPSVVNTSTNSLMASNNVIKSHIFSTVKRKQSSPKRIQDCSSSTRTELITITPRKLSKFSHHHNDTYRKNEGKNISVADILVPDTPQTQRKI